MFWKRDPWKPIARLVLKISKLLERNGEMRWAPVLEDIARRIKSHDYYGLEKFIQSFGGMGSLNDLVLQKDGKMPRLANEELDRLRSKSYDLALSLKRSLDRANDG